MGFPMWKYSFCLKGGLGTVFLREKTVPLDHVVGGSAVNLMEACFVVLASCQVVWSGLSPVVLVLMSVNLVTVWAWPDLQASGVRATWMPGLPVGFTWVPRWFFSRSVFVTLRLGYFTHPFASWLLALVDGLLFAVISSP